MFSTKAIPNKMHFRKNAFICPLLRRVNLKVKGPVFFKSGYPVGVFFKGCEIFSEKFKGSENNPENIKGSENFHF